MRGRWCVWLHGLRVLEGELLQVDNLVLGLVDLGGHVHAFVVEDLEFLADVGEFGGERCEVRCCLL